MIELKNELLGFKIMNTDDEEDDIDPFILDDLRDRNPFIHGQKRKPRKINPLNRPMGRSPYHFHKRNCIGWTKKLKEHKDYYDELESITNPDDPEKSG